VGWLRDLMDEAPAELRSFDELAKSCLKSDQWPASSPMQPRSLGAILGRLDRGEGTDWLLSRGEVQQVLANVLGVARGTLLVALSPRRAARAERWVTWHAMPLARGLDLTEEGLFPGVPEAVLRPGRWDRLIWVAPSGGGRTLAGQWLTARGLATHRVLPRIATGAVPERRPLLLELGSARGLTAAALGPGLCVAVPEPWEPPAGFGDCAIVRSPPIRELIEPLVHWAGERLAEGTAVDRDLLAARLLSLVELGMLESVGDALGLIGIADTEGMSVLEPKAVERVAREWLKRRGRERLDQEAPEAGWLRQHGFDALVSLTQHVITDGEDSLFLPRTLESWSELVPPDLRPGPDLEWMKIALPRADPSLRPAALERATEKLPPGAFRILRCLEHTGVLTREDGDALALRPHWLGRVLLHDALAKLVGGAAFDWGEALLAPATAPTTLERLVESARARTLVSEDIIEPEASSDAAYAAAIEGAVRAIGAAELTGVHAGADALEALWDEQLRLLVEMPDQIVSPRIEHAPARGRRGAFWLHRGAWYLALLAISEAFDTHQARRHPLLRPWQATKPPAGMSALLDRIAQALDADAPPEVIGPAILLVTRLGALLGPLGHEGARHRLERAATVADEATVGVLSWTSVAALEGDRLAILGLVHLVEHRRLEPGALAQQVWQAFAAAGSPEAETGVLLVPELARLVLPHAPNVALPSLARGMAALAEAPPLAPAQWAALLGSDAGALPLGLYRQVPEAFVGAAVDAACRALRGDALALLWSRFPRPLTRRVVHALTDPGAARTRLPLLESVPPEIAPEVLAELASVETLLRGPGANLEAVRRFLHACIAGRGPGFRDAYARFDEIERHLEHLRAQALERS
jgi:hypothetical protein